MTLITLQEARLGLLDTEEESRRTLFKRWNQNRLDRKSGFDIIKRLMDLAKMGEVLHKCKHIKGDNEDEGGEDELYSFLRRVMEGFWMMEELKTMNNFLSNAEETNPNDYEHIIEDEVMLKVSKRGKSSSPYF